MELSTVIFPVKTNPSHPVPAARLLFTAMQVRPCPSSCPETHCPAPSKWKEERILVFAYNNNKRTYYRIYIIIYNYIYICYILYIRVI
jgi:hypothetical protein